MSTLVARILLSMFMLPLGVVVYFTACLYFARRAGWNSENYMFVMAGLATWVFLAVYWLLVWLRQVKWNARRTIGTVVVALLAIGISYCTGMMVSGIERGIGSFAGSILAPILWLIGTVFLWKESRTERADRISATGDAVTCPTCGYNLTGLSEPRCPECGSRFTLNELLAGQPARQLAAMDKDVTG